MLCLPTTGGVLHITIGMIRKVTFQRQNPFILQHDVHTYISQTYLSSFPLNQLTVLLYELISKKT